MRPSAPSFVTFIISFILAALVIASKYFGVQIPVLTDIVRGNYFEVLLVAYVLLLLGVIFRRM
ncbi:MAG: hypothetical protein JJ964_05655 [Rhizobiales bacterium]|nr:hypothetical protein [Hyphomicrobiales bacterium]